MRIFQYLYTNNITVSAKEEKYSKIVYLFTNQGVTTIATTKEIQSTHDQLVSRYDFRVIVLFFHISLALSIYTHAYTPTVKYKLCLWFKKRRCMKKGKCGYKKGIFEICIRGSMGQYHQILELTLWVHFNWLVILVIIYFYVLLKFKISQTRYILNLKNFKYEIIFQ